MAKIVEVKLPEEYKDKNKYEIYTHLEQVATYAHNLKQQITKLKMQRLNFVMHNYKNKEQIFLN